MVIIPMIFSETGVAYVKDYQALVVTLECLEREVERLRDDVTGAGLKARTDKLVALKRMIFAVETSLIANYPEKLTVNTR